MGVTECAGCLSLWACSPALLPVTRLFGFVGLDAADVMGGAFHQGAHQVIGLSLQKREKELEVCGSLLRSATEPLL